MSLLCVPLAAAILTQKDDFRVRFHPGEVIAIEHATVIDGTGAAPQRNVSILMRGNRIEEVRSGLIPPRGARRIDAAGKFVIPGLCDMHTHVDDPELLELKPKPQEKEQWLPLFVLNGVTTIREMAGDLKLVQSWEKRCLEGGLLGPRIWCGGPLVDGPAPMWPASIAVSNAEEGRATVRRLKAEGADFVKVYSLLPRDAFFAICDEAKKQGIAVCGHVPVSVSNAEACEAGLNSIEHLLQLERELVDKTKFDQLKGEIPSVGGRGSRFETMARICADSYNPEAAKTLFRRYRELDVYVDPTLIVSYENAFYDPNDPVKSARTKYLPAYVREWWSPEKNVHIRDQSPEIRKGQQTIHAIRMRMIPALIDAGVSLLTGSDMGGNPHCFAGWGIHDELKLLVKAGLTPMQALVCATSNAAKYLKIYDRLGSISPGKLADLVILKDDPLTDIRNVSHIDAVLFDGRVYDRNRLDDLLKKQALAVTKRL